MFNFFRFSSLLLIFEEEKKEQINGFIFDLLAFLKLLDPDQTPGSGSNSWIWFKLLDPDQTPGSGAGIWNLLESYPQHCL